jgi:glycosyltransferase involved in cell wall biosynthesis
MKSLRILVLAPDSNPDSLSTSLVGYAHSEALARHNVVTLVAKGCHEAVLRRKPIAFHAIQPISTPWLDRIYRWIIQHVFKGDYGSHLLTALSYPFAVVFEWKAWRLLRPRIMAGEFDVVLRLLPVVPTLPSPFAFFLRHGPIPFVIGPINGGLPWPQGFRQAEKQKEWISDLRNLYRILPFAKSTYHNAAAIIAGSSETYAEFAAYREKMFFVPENGLSRSLFDSAPCRPPGDGRLELIYVGRLVPYKACDLALRGSASLLRQDLARLSIVGDGPERQGLEQLAKSLGIEKAVTFCGWLSHSEAMQRLLNADVLVFPSIREFGGGVVFEALALGVVPVVADFGGPGDIVHPEVGFKVALTNEQDMITQIDMVLMCLVGDRKLLAGLQRQGMAYARERLSWDGKARIVSGILNWAVGGEPKPILPPPKFLPENPSRI